MHKILWMAVTPDEYEFPLYVADTCSELAKKFNTTISNVICNVNKGYSGKIAGRKFIKVSIKESEDEA